MGFSNFLRTIFIRFSTRRSHIIPYWTYTYAYFIPDISWNVNFILITPVQLLNIDKLYVNIIISTAENKNYRRICFEQHAFALVDEKWKYTKRISTRTIVILWNTNWIIITTTNTTAKQRLNIVSTLAKTIRNYIL